MPNKNLKLTEFTLIATTSQCVHTPCLPVVHFVSLYQWHKPQYGNDQTQTSNCSCEIDFPKHILLYHPVFHELVSGTYRVSSIVQSSTNWYSEHTRYQVAGWS